MINTGSLRFCDCHDKGSAFCGNKMKNIAKKISISFSTVLCFMALVSIMCACSGQNNGFYVVKCAHNYTEKVVNATCTAAGYTLHTCTKCGNSYRDNEVAALGHKVSADWEANASQHWHECENGCGEKISLGNHNWNSGEVLQANSCETAGKIKYTCTVCGFERTDVLPATGHNLSSVYVSDSTSHWHTCANNQSERIDYASHSWDSGYIVKAATCKSEGQIDFTCTVCGRVYSKVIPRTDHNKAAEWASDSSYHWHVCLDCGEVFDKASHSFGEPTILKEPTCTEKGTAVKVCTVCGGFERYEIEALGHSVSEKWSKNKESHWHNCENGCGDKFAEAAHTFDEGTVYMAPTCTSNGLMKFVCSVCKFAIYETIPAIGHEIDVTEWHFDETKHWHECDNDCGGKFDAQEHDFEVTVVPPTATEQGYTLHKCKECGYEYKDNYTDPTG